MSKGFLARDYMLHKTSITGDHYADLIRKLRSAIGEKRRGMLTKGASLVLDQTPVPKTHTAPAAIHAC